MNDSTGFNIGETLKPFVGALGDLLKLGLMVGVPLLVLVFCGWFAFIRWSQHGVDL